MTLDLSKIAPQIVDMVVKLKTGDRKSREHLQNALNKVADDSLNIEKLKRKIAAGAGKTTWLVAGLVEGFNKRHSAPVIPADFTVLAADGSQLEYDRNQSARCILINIGTVLLKYGANPEAQLESLPHLYSDDSELVIQDPQDSRNERAIDSGLLGIKRSVEECHKLAELAQAQPESGICLALTDGTLILWGLEAYPAFVSEVLLKQDYLDSLENLRKLAETRRLALASYISLPRTTEVVNSLRVAICPQLVPNCDNCPQIEGAHACDIVSGVQDQMLFSNLLKPGERSAIFFSQSSVVEKYYERNRIYFYYLRVEDEIGRVEIPEWVAMQKELLELTHTLVLDQCQRGQGYPVALSEAHEQAVVTSADREEFWALVEQSMLDEKMTAYTSTKSRSKRTRWI